MIKAAREVAAGRDRLATRRDLARLLAIREIGTWTAEMVHCTGSGAWTSCPRAISAISSSSGAS